MVGYSSRYAVSEALVQAEIWHQTLASIFFTCIKHLGNGEDHRDYPDGHDELDGPGQLADGVWQEGVADGDVPLHREGGDGQHRGVGRRLRRVPRQHTERLAKHVWVARMCYIQLA